MAVKLNETALSVLLDSQAGPVGREIQRRAADVEQIALQNASGGILQIRSSDLISNLTTTVFTDTRGTVAKVGSSAEHRGFRYPGFLDENGFPWLTEALADVFPGEF